GPRPGRTDGANSRLRIGATIASAAAIPPIPVCHLPVLVALDYFTDRWSRVVTVGLVVYGVIYVWRALRAFSGAAQPRAVLLSVALLCGCVWLGHEVYLFPSVWLKKEPNRRADSTWRAAVSEPLLFDQQHRIDEALSKV